MSSCVRATERKPRAFIAQYPRIKTGIWLFYSVKYKLISVVYQILLTVVVLNVQV